MSYFDLGRNPAAAAFRAVACTVVAILALSHAGPAAAESDDPDRERTFAYLFSPHHTPYTVLYPGPRDGRDAALALSYLPLGAYPGAPAFAYPPGSQRPATTDQARIAFIPVQPVLPGPYINVLVPFKY